MESIQKTAIRKWLERLLSVLLLFFLFQALYHGSVNVRMGDVYFNTDIARDFLLYSEIDEKGLILIGPRSSTGGLFHGPAWLYLTYPGYLLGDGNPVAMGWYWLALIIVFLSTTYLLYARLIGRIPALILATTLSQAMSFHINGLLNPHGALFFIPIYLWLLFRYTDKGSIRTLFLHFLVGALIIQFQMAVGIPLVLLSVGYLVYRLRSHRRWIHLTAVLGIPLGLMNFIIFEIRHGFQMTKTLLSYSSPQTAGGLFDYASMIPNRLAFGGNLQLYLGSDTVSSFVFFFVTVLLLVIVMKIGIRQRMMTGTLIYFYVGYMILTFINKGGILYHQFFPIMAVTHLLFASLHIGKAKWFAYPILLFLITANSMAIAGFARHQLSSKIGKDEDSWKFLSGMANDLIKSAQSGSGYFVYSPDAFGYEPKYALSFANAQSGNPLARNIKTPLTYVVTAPHPPDNPFMEPDWWIREKLKIYTEPVTMRSYGNGYALREYELTPEEMANPIDSTADPGIHFR